MIYIFNIIFIVCQLTLISCTNKKNLKNNNISFNQIYISIQNNIKNNNYTKAIEELHYLEKIYPFNPYRQQINITLIYSYYKLNNFLKAKNLIDQFLRLNLIHTQLDYILYMRGLINMALDYNTFHKYFHINRTDRTTEHIQEAIQDFKKLIQYFPHSQYIIDTNYRLNYLNNRIAKYDLAVIKYYDQCGAYISVVNRFAKILSDCSDTRTIWKTLPYLHKAYLKLKLDYAAKQIEKIMSSIN
ncbi:outer membrane protein assembly factor BamD [Candidatus Schneideria nysicola]|uniref:outer membrane protein assembly factor BamD n=1 Tax=Candidatus Schneideria nysicola TaxID=1081631 RepID=UPI001CAA79C3|nr:outer membrane protein assembly factor BamD [Candidatus Schneideria nysicola]UAJ64857.1 outer membrane protein assembly factor BamD [Candidatus Schneideria nysicola]UAJ65391.1 outer membrane protein assembly factor BamD [Candidatus Schneideria nysicola]